jgi:Cysteine-rich CWC
VSSTPSSTPEGGPRCPRCGQAFACGAQAGVCDCFTIQTSEALRQALALAYPGACVCLTCLKALASGAETLR